VRVLNFK